RCPALRVLPAAAPGCRDARPTAPASTPGPHRLSRARRATSSPGHLASTRPPPIPSSPHWYPATFGTRHYRPDARRPDERHARSPATALTAKRCDGLAALRHSRRVPPARPDRGAPAPQRGPPGYEWHCDAGYRGLLPASHP